MIKGGKWADVSAGLAALKYARPGSTAQTNPTLEALVKAWLHSESQFQDVAATSLRGIGAPAVPAIAVHLRKGDADTRRRAAALLGEIASPAATRALVGIVSSDDAALAWIADRALARAHKTRPLLRLHSTPEKRAQAAKAWARHAMPRR
jgi:HEAT repeat protein